MVKQPSIVGDVWFNTKPLSEADLKDKVVLVDFWTYSCANCLRTLPYLKEWWQKYKDKGLVVIGIHTPEFDFEKDPRNVKEAIKNLGIDWPVVLDNKHLNWHKFNNRYWPAKYLSGSKGNISYIHFGEGNYAQTEEAIQKEIRKVYPEITLPEIASENGKKGGVCFIPTPELYCGYQRGNLSNPGGYEIEKPFEYAAPKSLRQDSIALDGQFIAAAEYVESVAKDARLMLKFRSAETNLVLAPAGKSAKIKMTLNGKAIGPGIRGRDVGPDDTVNVTEPRMYNLLSGKRESEGTLSIQSSSGSFKAFAFTFSGCVTEK